MKAVRVLARGLALAIFVIGCIACAFVVLDAVQAMHMYKSLNMDPTYARGQVLRSTLLMIAMPAGLLAASVMLWLLADIAAVLHCKNRPVR
jgi:hypothetical protein